MAQGGPIVDRRDLWLLPLGFLVIRSRAFPRILGALLILGCGLCLVELALFVARPPGGSDAGIQFFAVGGLAELVFLLWLLIRGVSRPPRPAAVGTFGRP